ncbi:CSC1-like protein HYP1 isoform X1 [Phoenix dactylifera]|uniref:CSC1-like protein HYP1 isoform X1 n=1 Tax=Phoenix dactylifera TaxID=42345 RepID=A0A8B7BLE8_PHODC|nr:CSC1-like protein HYP1 isoform X1 [Phoenix dactylifera]
MIVSALLTSVGINLGLCVLFFVLYSILRKQPGNIKFYAPRLVAEGRARQRSEFNIESLLPSPGWVRKALEPSEEDLLASCGLDAVVFMRILIFSLRVFSVAAVVGICILLPVNYLGDQLRDIDFSDLPNKSLDLFSISNVKDGSNRLWFHFSAAYLITGVVCFLLYFEYKNISEKRLAYFNASKPQAHHFTVLVRDIPKHEGGSLSDTVERFFMEYYPSTYLSHVVVHRTNKLRGLITDAENLYRRLAHLKSRPATSQNNCCGSFLGLFQKKVDLAGHYAKKLEDLEENVRTEQLAREEVPAAFVCFKSRYGAATALHIRQSLKPTEWVTEEAPEPQDVYWPFFSTSFMQRWMSKVVVLVASVLLIVVFLIIVAFVQGLTYLDQLEIWLPFLKKVLTITVVSQVITGYLPSLILHFVSSYVPSIMKLFSTMQGYIAHSEIEKSACYKMLLFTIWILFFANVLTGSVTSQLQIILDPKNIPSRLAVVVPAQASFFIAYVVTSWTSLSSELTRMIPLIVDLITRNCSRCKSDELQIPSIRYHSEIPRLLAFGLLGLVYFILAPLILLFLLVFFCIGYIIYRNQLLNVYLPKYETGGRFWPIVHNSTIFSLILMHIIAIGIFGLKQLPLASSLILPLPVLTLLFNDYCRKRFLPIFQAYSAETLIRKDREDQNDPAKMAEFFDKLVTAYRDPSLMPINHFLNSNERTSPLLFSADG